LPRDVEIRIKAIEDRQRLPGQGEDRRFAVCNSRLKRPF
jgi:hypothetical protein